MKRQYGDACVSLQQVGPLKEALGGKKFSTDDDIKEAVRRWLRSQSEEFFFSRNPGISEALAHLH
jgi:hypothetical protein